FGNCGPPPARTPPGCSHGNDTIGVYGSGPRPGLGISTGLLYTEEQNILIRYCFGVILGAAIAVTSSIAADLPDSPRQVTRVVRADPRTGKLVRAVVVTSKPVAALNTTAAARAAQAPAPPASVYPSAGIADAVEQIAAQHDLPSQLIHSVIKVESN